MTYVKKGDRNKDKDNQFDGLTPEQVGYKLALNMAGFTEIPSNNVRQFYELAKLCQNKPGSVTIAEVAEIMIDYKFDKNTKA